jgi:hypothetical protein
MLLLRVLLMQQQALQGFLWVGPCWQQQQLRLQLLVWAPWEVLLLLAVQQSP